MKTERLSNFQTSLFLFTGDLVRASITGVYYHFTLKDLLNLNIAEELALYIAFPQPENLISELVQTKNKHICDVCVRFTFLQKFSNPLLQILLCYLKQIIHMDQGLQKAKYEKENIG